MNQMTSGQRWRVGLGIVGALIFFVAGIQMLTIESQAGDTIFEAFFAGVGVFSFAMAFLILVLAIPESPKGESLSATPPPRTNRTLTEDRPWKGIVQRKRGSATPTATDGLNPAFDRELVADGERADNDDNDAQTRLWRFAEQYGLKVESHESWSAVATSIVEARQRRDRSQSP